MQSCPRGRAPLSWRYILPLAMYFSGLASVVGCAAYPAAQEPSTEQVTEALIDLGFRVQRISLRSIAPGLFGLDQERELCAPFRTYAEHHDKLDHYTQTALADPLPASLVIPGDQSDDWIQPFRDSWLRYHKQENGNTLVRVEELSSRPNDSEAVGLARWNEIKDTVASSPTAPFCIEGLTGQILKNIDPTNWLPDYAQQFQWQTSILFGATLIGTFAAFNTGAPEPAVSKTLAVLTWIVFALLLAVVVIGGAVYALTRPAVSELTIPLPGDPSGDLDVDPETCDQTCVENAIERLRRWIEQMLGELQRKAGERMLEPGAGVGNAHEEWLQALEASIAALIELLELLYCGLTDPDHTAFWQDLVRKFSERTLEKLKADLEFMKSQLAAQCATAEDPKSCNDFLDHVFAAHLTPITTLGFVVSIDPSTSCAGH